MPAVYQVPGTPLPPSTPSLTLGSQYQLPAGIGLAPMEGVTDFPTRLWYRILSHPDALVTPFLRVTATYPPREYPLAWAPELLAPELRGAFASPTLPQLMASDEDAFLRAALPLLERSGMVELNCGCPAPTVVGKGAGSGLLRDPKVFHSFVSKIASELGGSQLSVKMRTGYDSAEAFAELTSCLPSLPLHRLVVHGRTRADRYQGLARWDLTEDVANQIPYPVIGSGDINDLASLEQRRVFAPAVQGLIIGRGALRNPLIFSELRQGRKPPIVFATLKEVLYSYALLHEASHDGPELLIGLAAEGFFAQPYDLDHAAWERLNLILCERLSAPPPPQARYRPVALRTLGRLKMLWSYLRSSLPQEFFEPQVLRCRNLPDFFAYLDKVYELYCLRIGVTVQAAPSLELRWQKEYDWIYAGEKKAESAAQPS